MNDSSSLKRSDDSEPHDREVDPYQGVGDLEEGNHHEPEEAAVEDEDNDDINEDENNYISTADDQK